jgi:hypothetical protein
MASKNSGANNPKIQLERDDFTLIRGIGPGIADRLNNAGVHTYTQLAALSPNKVVRLLGDLIGMTSERVVKQDWIGQARNLQTQREQALNELQRGEEHAERQPYATFTLELLLGSENDVRRTHIMHVQDKDEEAWAGWDAARMLDFFINHAELRISPVEPEQAAIESSEASLPVTQPSGLAGNPRLEELVSLPSLQDKPSRILREDQTFGVRMTLDLSGVQSTENMPLDYAATIYAKQLGSGKRWLVGEAKGFSTPEEKVTVGVEEASLPEGLYRLEASVVLKQPSQSAGLRPELITQLEGGLIRIG